MTIQSSTDGPELCYNGVYPDQQDVSHPKGNWALWTRSDWSENRGWYFEVFSVEHSSYRLSVGESFVKTGLFFVCKRSAAAFV